MPLYINTRYFCFLQKESSKRLACVMTSTFIYFAALLAFGKSWLKVRKPEHNLISSFLHCIWVGKLHLKIHSITFEYINTKLQLGIKDKVKQKCCHYGYSSYHFNQNTQENSHWLHPAYSHYDFKFVSGVRDILSVCSLFLFYPVFWALFEQMVSIIFCIIITFIFWTSFLAI